MTTQTSNQINNFIPHGGTWGNKSECTFAYNPGTDSPGANLGVGDVVQLFQVQAGTKLIDAMAFVANALAALTLKLGYAAQDGSTGTTNGVADKDDSYFFNAEDVHLGGRFRADTNKPPVVLQKDSYIIATFGGAAFPTTNTLTVEMEYNFVGND